jgi:acyl-ACP thioesterase
LKKEIDVVFREEHVVQSFAIDMRGRIFPHFLFTYMMNSAWNAVKHSSYHYRVLRDKGQFWALSKFAMDIDSFPGWNDRIVVETWGTGIDRYLAFREFCIFSAGGDKMAVGNSSWLVLDRERYRPQRLEPLVNEFNFKSDRGLVSHKLEKIQPLKKAQPLLAVPVKYSDIDVNQHVTAARYLQWILDSYAPQFYQTRKLSAVEINFIAEAKMGDDIVVKTETDDVPQGKRTHNVTRQQDDKELCRARLRWTS